MTYEQKRALRLSIELPTESVAYLEDDRHPKNPECMGREIGYELTWSIACREMNRPEWDERLVKRVWKFGDFSPMTEVVPGTIMAGICAGHETAE
jgi:hypothetical protein